MIRSRIIVLLLAAVVVLTCETYADCADGQIYKDCGTACPATCDNPNPPCTRQCVVGCQCPYGMYTTSDDSCIDPSECPVA